MNEMLDCKFCKTKKDKRKFTVEIDIEQLLRKILLNSYDAEIEVLDNLNKIEIMQFLGLKDKTDRPIYFGDILIDEMNNLLTPAIEIENDEHVLFFKPIKHLNKPLLKMGCKSTFSKTLVVIGNIYTNSELFIGLRETDKILKLMLSSRFKELKRTAIPLGINCPLYI